MQHRMITGPWQETTETVNKLLDEGWTVIPETVALKTDKISGRLIMTTTVARQLKFNPPHP